MKANNNDLHRRMQMAEEQAKARIYTAAQQQMMDQQRAQWVQQFMMETAQKLFVELVMSEGAADDIEMVQQCAKQANELSVEFGLSMGLIHRAEEEA